MSPRITYSSSLMYSWGPAAAPPLSCICNNVVGTRWHARLQQTTTITAPGAHAHAACATCLLTPLPPFTCSGRCCQAPAQSCHPRCHCARLLPAAARPRPLLACSGCCEVLPLQRPGPEAVKARHGVVPALPQQRGCRSPRRRATRCCVVGPLLLLRGRPACCAAAPQPRRARQPPGPCTWQQGA